MDSKNKHLAANLRLMCNRYPSIADVCRRLKINRQQFNKYLGGQSNPSLHNLHRISDFFGVDEAELLLPHDQFSRIVFSRGETSHIPGSFQKFFRQNNHLLAHSLEEMKRYCGYYFMYHRSPDWPQALVKSLFLIFQDGETTFAKTIENQCKIDGNGTQRKIHKVDSVIFFDAARIYALERDSHLGGSNSFMILYPSDHRTLTLLQGLMMSVSMAGDRRPFASRIAFEYLGKKPTLKKALKSCGIYSEGHDAISKDIWNRTSNEISPTSETLVPAI